MFTKLDPRWWIDEGDYVLAHSEFWFEAAEINHTSCGISLDLGCGHGRFAIPLSSISDMVICLDINHKMLQSLKTRVCKFKVTGKICPVLSDIQRLPFRDRCFNMVNFIGTMIHVPNQIESLEEASRVTRIGGRVIVDQTNYFSLRFLWEALKIGVNRVFQVGWNPQQKIFVKRCNFWGFKKMFKKVGLHIVKVEGFQIIPFLPLLGLYHDARFHIIPLNIANRLDKYLRRTRLVRFAYNFLIIGTKN